MSLFRFYQRVKPETLAAFSGLMCQLYTVCAMPVVRCCCWAHDAAGFVVAVVVAAPCPETIVADPDLDPAGLGLCDPVQTTGFGSVFRSDPGQFFS